MCQATNQQARLTTRSVRERCNWAIAQRRCSVSCGLRSVLRHQSVPPPFSSIIAPLSYTLSTCHWMPPTFQHVSLKPDGRRCRCRGGQRQASISASHPCSRLPLSCCTAGLPHLTHSTTQLHSSAVTRVVGRIYLPRAVAFLLSFNSH